MLQQAALRALSYLEKREKICDPLVRIVLLHLKKRYWKEKYSDAMFQKLEAVLRPRHRPLLRLVEPQYQANENTIKMLRGIDRITASALYCQQYALPWDFYKEVETWAHKGGYAATHGLWALVLLEERGCTQSSERHNQVRALLVDSVAKIAAAATPLTDLRIEAILMLQLAGITLKPEWLAEIYLAQSADGSVLGNDHSTALAAWLFLDFSQR
ncbi:MAG: hypothetical protein NZL89_02600 [Leptospiraceae bacterium]|nr:hypothetical protein [Leptospiraceae bacterium]